MMLQQWDRRKLWGVVLARKRLQVAEWGALASDLSCVPPPPPRNPTQLCPESVGPAIVFQRGGRCPVSPAAGSSQAVVSRILVSTRLSLAHPEGPHKGGAVHVEDGSPAVLWPGSQLLQGWRRN